MPDEKSLLHWSTRYQSSKDTPHRNAANRNVWFWVMKSLFHLWGLSKGGDSTRTETLQNCSYPAPTPWGKKKIISLALVFCISLMDQAGHTYSCCPPGISDSACTKIHCSEPTYPAVWDQLTMSTYTVLHFQKNIPEKEFSQLYTNNAKVTRVHFGCFQSQAEGLSPHHKVHQMTSSGSKPDWLSQNLPWGITLPKKPALKHSTGNPHPLLPGVQPALSK